MFAFVLQEMISETASESAWSTDVLNSDTSERPSDRLRELDQIVSMIISKSREVMYVSIWKVRQCVGSDWLESGNQCVGSDWLESGRANVLALID